MFHPVPHHSPRNIKKKVNFTLIKKIILNILYTLQVISGEINCSIGSFFKKTTNTTVKNDKFYLKFVVFIWRCQKFDDLPIQASWHLFVNIITKNILTTC